MTQHLSTNMSAQSIHFDAKPEPVTLDLSKTAIVVIDMQNDFGGLGGLFDRAGIDISMIRQAIEPTARVLETARGLGVKIVYLKMAFHPDLSDLGAADSVNRVRHLAYGVGQTVHAPDGTDSRVLVRDTWNTDIVSELAPQTGDVIICKHRYSGFYQTNLDDILQRWGIKYLVVTGCTTSVCVESTVRDAMFRDYACVLLSDCMAEPIGQGFSRSNHDASLMLIQTLFGWVSDADTFINATERLAISNA
jgi:ureidoacrylate peracid hydrolase